MAELINDTESKIKWHSLEEQEVLKKLLSKISGLTNDEVAERRKEFGKNSLPARKAPGVFVVFLHQFLSPLIYVLLVAGIISALIGDVKDAGFIFGVILLNACLGTFQEWKAEKHAAALQNLLKTTTVVRRGGEEITIDTEDLVPGDIVILESGNKVPADIRILKEKNLDADESLLTGESLPVHKNTTLLAEEVEVHERSNMIFAGTVITTGRATGIVVETGLNTQIGQIAQSVVKTKGTKPPLVIRMEKFSRNISYITLIACVLLGVVAIYRGMDYIDVFFFAVALVVAAIPEGLPVAMTVALSIATSRMSKKNVIVRKLAAVESLGSCTCIASDKTGTLTLNKQTVKTIWLPSHERFDLTGEGYEGTGEILSSTGESINKESKTELNNLAEAAVICNEAVLVNKNNKWEHHGDTVDIALLAMGYKAGINFKHLFDNIKITGEIPFESDIRFSAKFYKGKHGDEVVVKGAVETLLAHCDTVMLNGKPVKINPSEIEKAAYILAEEGYRVIAVARGKTEKPINEKDIKERPLNEKDLPSLTFVGLIGLIDPVRTEVKDSIKKCEEAGVKVIMITGDHPATAFAIAKELDIAKDKKEIITGKELSEIGTPDVPEFLEAVKNATVFARVTPIQKLEIVTALMKLGHFVAVTGDGVNDVPALHKANIGVAMGSGTDVAKDTASIIITDDNFVSIVAGIEEGRYAYNNIRKVIYLLISQGAAEIALFTLALFAGLPMPLLAVQLLWLNLATNGIQDVALAFEGGEEGVMKHPPRKPKENIFNRQMLKQVLISGLTMSLLAFFMWSWLINSGSDEFGARNLLLLFMVLMENFHALNCRSEYVSAFKIPFNKNTLLIFGILTAQLLHILSMYVPFMQDILKTEPIDFTEWLALAPLAAFVLVVMEIYKILQRRHKRKTQPA